MDILQSRTRRTLVPTHAPSHDYASHSYIPYLVQRRACAHPTQVRTTTLYLLLVNQHGR